MSRSLAHRSTGRGTDAARPNAPQLLSGGGVTLPQTLRHLSGSISYIGVCRQLHFVGCLQGRALAGNESAYPIHLMDKQMGEKDNSVKGLAECLASLATLKTRANLTEM